MPLNTYIVHYTLTLCTIPLYQASYTNIRIITGTTLPSASLHCAISTAADYRYLHACIMCISSLLSALSSLYTFTYISTPLGTGIGFAEIDAIRITGREANAAAPGGASDATLHALTACSHCTY